MNRFRSSKCFKISGYFTVEISNVCFHVALGFLMSRCDKASQRSGERTGP